MKSRTVRFRLALESALAALTAALAVTTLLWHDWAETIFGIDPDRGGGEFEIAVTVLLAAATIGFALAARVEWRRRLAPGDA
jgi:hypothetical protein